MEIRPGITYHYFHQLFVRSGWASSSAGRAPRSQRGGRRFDPGLVHQSFQQLSPLSETARVAQVAQLSRFRQSKAKTGPLPTSNENRGPGSTSRNAHSHALMRVLSKSASTIRDNRTLQDT